MVNPFAAVFLQSLHAPRELLSFTLRTSWNGRRCLLRTARAPATLHSGLESCSPWIVWRMEHRSFCSLQDISDFWRLWPGMTASRILGYICVNEERGLYILLSTLFERSHVSDIVMAESVYVETNCLRVVAYATYIEIVAKKRPRAAV